MKNKSIGYRIFTVCNFLILLAVLAITLLPYLHVFAKAFNDGKDTMLGGLTFWPRKFTLDNFSVLFTDKSIYRAVGITIARVLTGLVGGLLVQFMAGYVLSRNDLPHRGIIMVFFVIPMFFSAGIIPTYVLYSKVGLLNNFWVYVLPGLFSLYNVIIVRSFIISSVPDSIIEAARIDGMGEISIFFKMVLPLCKPILATVGLWIAVAHWNDWATTLYYIRSPKLHTLMYKLTLLLKESERFQQMLQEAAKTGNTLTAASQVTTPDSIVAAQIVITTVPIIMVYPFLQKYFIKGVTLGAVKG